MLFFFLVSKSTVQLGDTPLHEAARLWRNVETCKLLISNGHPVHVRNNVSLDHLIYVAFRRDTPNGESKFQLQNDDGTTCLINVTHTTVEPIVFFFLTGYMS